MLKELVWLGIAVTLSMTLAACGGGGGGGGGGDGTTSVTSISISPANKSVQSKAILTLSLFGNGSVAADQGGLICQDPACEASYTKGTSVTLTATPDDGWTLDHWVGCDTSVDLSCSVTLSQDKTVQPFFAKSAPPTINSDVVVLTDATMNSLVSIDNTVLIFSNSATQLQSILAGNIIISAQGSGFARRVLKITAFPGGNYVIDTSVVSLADIIDDGVIIGKQTPTPQQKITPIRLAAGVSIKESAPLAINATTSLTLDVDVDGKAKITGDIEISWNPEVALDFRLTQGLTNAKLLINPTIKPNIIVAWNGVDVDKEILFDLGAFTLSPILIQAGPVPIVIVPTVKGFVKFTATAGVQVDFVSSYSVQGSYGIQYSKGIGWKGINSTMLNGSFNPSGNVSLEGQIGVGTYAAFSIYDVLGPFIQVGPYLKATGTFDPSPTSGICKRFKVDIGIAAKAGGDLHVFNWYDSTVEVDILDKILLPLKDWAGPNCSDADPPTPPSNVAALPSGSGKLRISWTASTDNVGVSYYEVYRDGTYVGRSSIASYTDTNLLPNRTYCYSVYAADAAGNKSVPNSDACGKTTIADSVPPSVPANLSGMATSTTAIHLSWADSQDNVGVAGYAVWMNGKNIITTGYTSSDALKLQPNTTYCFAVSALDAAGNFSERSAQSCIKTLPLALVAWTMKFGCVNAAYLITKGLDIDVDSQNNVDVADDATDYDNTTKFVYHLYGSYSPDSKTLTAKITSTFADSSRVRVDTFSANLSNTDTGDIAMTQVQQTGCDAQVRFVKN